MKKLFYLNALMIVMPLSFLQAGITDYLSYPGLTMYKKGHDVCFKKPEITEDAAMALFNQSKKPFSHKNPPLSHSKENFVICEKDPMQNYLAEELPINKVLIQKTEDSAAKTDILTWKKSFTPIFVLIHWKDHYKSHPYNFTPRYWPNMLKHASYTQTITVDNAVARSWVQANRVFVPTKVNEDQTFDGDSYEFLTEQHRDAAMNEEYKMSYKRAVRNSLLMGLIGLGIFEAKTGALRSLFATNKQQLPLSGLWIKASIALNNYLYQR